MERCKRHEKAQFEKAYSEKAQIKIKWESPPKHRTKSIRNHGGSLGPEQSPPLEGGWQMPPWGVRPHQGAAAPLVGPPGHSLLEERVRWFPKDGSTYDQCRWKVETALGGRFWTFLCRDHPFCIEPPPLGL